MKFVSILTIAAVALIAVCSSAPLVNQQLDSEARLDIYNDFLAGLFSGLIQTTFGSVSGFLNQLITENPLGVGKRDAEEDLAARASAFGFIYDNILANFFSGIVNNAFTASGNALLNLIETNPLGIGKRDAEEDLAARASAFGFIYDNILANFFSGIVNNAFTAGGNALLNLIETNPLGIGKRAEGSKLNIFQFLNDNVFGELVSSLASNTANYLQNSLNNLLSKPFANLNIGKREVDIQQAQALVSQTVSTLVQKFKTFAKEAIASKNDRQKLNQLVKDNIADIKSTVTNLAQQLSKIVPQAITNEVAQVLAMLRSMLVFWTSGLGGSLGPVIGPFNLSKN